MGACASCLGLNRHRSREVDESDPLLDESQISGYGGTSAHVDEEELRREREAMERVTSEATEGMIDVLHPDAVESGQYFTQANAQIPADTNGDEQRPDDTTGLANVDITDGDADVTSLSEGEDKDEEEAAWLQGIESAEIERLTAVNGLDNGALVMDLGDLKDNPTNTPAKRALRANLDG